MTGNLERMTFNDLARMFALGVRRVTVTDRCADELMGAPNALYNPGLSSGTNFKTNQIGRICGIDIFREALSTSKDALPFCPQCGTHHDANFGLDFHDRKIQK